jgi:dihydroorotate dehydrogenase
MYFCLRWFLFRLDPERAHERVLVMLKHLHRLGVLGWFAPKVETDPKSWFGVRFPNPIGLAAGLDKNGEYIEALAAIGFGFIEVGTVTPRPQPGNEKPRLFRLPKAHALINRLGFNNKGVDYLLTQIRASHYTGVLGINIGKNADTPLDKAKDDYLYCLERVYLYASYIVINISSPNTQGLRDLQHGQYFDDLLSSIVKMKTALASQNHRVVPILVKVSPDLTPDQIEALAASILAHRIDGVVATNTTLSRQEIAGIPDADQAGGLSGPPLAPKSTNVIAQFRKALGPHVPIIGVGGVESLAGAQQKLQVGANLLQVYTGFIYQGPRLIHRLVKYCK